MAEELIIRVTADVDEARKGLTGIANDASKTADSLNKVGPAATSAGVGIDKLGNSASAAAPATAQVASGVNKIVSSLSQLPPLANTSADSTRRFVTQLKETNSVLLAVGNGTPKATSQIIKLQLGVSKLGDTLETLKAKANVTRDFINVERDVTKVAILQKQLQSLEAEIIRVQNLGKQGAASDFSGLIGGANQAFSILRKVAFILPGVGVAGILGGLSDVIIKIGKNLFGITDDVENVTDAFGDLTKTLEELQSVSNIKITASGTTQGELEKVRALAQAIKNTNLSYGERKAAIEELQKINKSYFGDLTLEASSLATLTDRVNEYTQALIQAAVVKGFQDEISKFAPQLQKANKAFNDNIEAIKKWQTILDAFKQTPEFLSHNAAQQIEDIGSFATKNIDIFKKYQDAQAAIAAQTPELQKARSAYADIEDAIQLAVDESLKFKPLTDPTKDVQKGLDETQRKIITLAKEAEKVFNVPLTLKFDNTNSSQQQLENAIKVLSGIKDFTIKARVDITLPDIKELPKEQIDRLFKNVPSAFEDAINKGIVDAQGREFKIDTGPFSKEIEAEIERFNQAGLKIPVTFDLKDADLLIKLREAFKLETIKASFKFDPSNIQKSLSDVSKLILTDTELQEALNLSVKLHADPSQFAKAINDIKNSLSDLDIKKLDIALQVGDIEAVGLLQATANLTDEVNKAIEQAIEGISTEALATLGQTIGDALSGGDIGKGFEEFGKALGQAVEALGKQLIALGVATAIAKAGLKSLNPALTIAAGIALVAIGEALKNLLGGGIQGFEKGGRPPVGEWVIVGEKGPELVKFDQPGRVFSNSDSQRMLSSSVSSSSVKDHETIREYLIAAKVSQQLKEHFSYAFKSIENTIKTVTASHDKLISYSYKLHESIERIIEKPSVVTIVKGDNESAHYENSFERIVTSLKDHSSVIDKLHEKISERSDKSVTIERIINNNFFSSDSFKETFKSMSLNDMQKTFHIPAFAQGGAVFGPTLAILGEGFGISRGNPEFVGTRSQLSGIQGGQFDVNVNVDGELSFDMGKLAIALNRNQRSSFRTSGKPGF